MESENNQHKNEKLSIKNNTKEEFTTTIPSPKSDKSSLNVSRAFIFTFLRTYGGFPLNLLLTYLIQIILGKEMWGYLLAAFVLVASFRILLNFIPPSVSAVFDYVLPKYLANNQQSKVKGFIFYILKLQVPIALLTTIGVYIYLFYFFPDKTSPYFSLIFILSSINIIEVGVGTLNLMKSLMKIYYIDFINFLIEKFGYLGVYIYLLIQTNFSLLQKIQIIAIMYCLIRAGQLIVLSISFHSLFGKIKSEKVSWNEIRNTAIYGFKFTITDAFTTIYNQAYVSLIDSYGLIYYNTYNNLNTNIQNDATGILNLPLAPIFGELEHSNQHEKMENLLLKILKILNIISTFIIGFVYWVIPLYIYIIYDLSYVEVIITLQIFLFSIYFSNFETSFRNLLIITKHENKVIALDNIMMMGSILFAAIGIIWFGFPGLLLSKFITLVIKVGILWKMTQQQKTLKINMLKQFFPYFIIISLCIMTQFLFGDINYSTSLLRLIYEFGIRAGTFGILNFLCIRYFKILTRQDLESIERIPIKIPFKKVIFSILKPLLKEQ